MSLPSGTVTFLFTDIEGSTKLWEEHRASMSEALERHDRILRDAVATSGGVVFSTGGDGLAAAFQRASDAIRAAVDAQIVLQHEVWAPPLSVRMAIHTGDVEERSGDYFGPPLNRCARLMAAGHGGQVLCSGVSTSLAEDQLPDGSRFRGLGAHRLRDLSEPEHVYQVEHPNLRCEFPPLRSLDSYRGNLPTQPTAFVGRDTEVAEISKALGEARMITLCGVGGVGKTRLALQVAADVLPHFPDGAWVVELASVGAAEAVEEAVASALGVQPAPGSTLGHVVLDNLKSKSLLLILDNCEHLLNAVASFVDSALRTAPALTILATSREGLAVSGERLVTVPSLCMPDATMDIEDLVITDAVRLFTERAQDARSNFDAKSEDVRAIGELCRRLDGIPLAIELAAARIRVMAPKEILDHLDRRFKLLTAGRRTAVSRHQTLRNTLDWSYDLLEEGERIVFRRLSVFFGGFDLSVAELVLSDYEIDAFDIADLVFRLVEKSLVVAQPSSGLTRYRLLETIRDYSWEQLTASGESDDLARRHCRQYLDLAEEFAPGLCGPQEMEARGRIETELDNFRAALRWAIDADEVDLALRLVDALSIAGSIRSPFGTLPIEASEMDGARGHPLVSVALAAAAAALNAQGDHRRAMELAEDSLASAYACRGIPSGNQALCHTFGNVSMVANIQHDLTQFVAMARTWVEVALELDDPFEISQAFNLLGSIVPDPKEGLDACERAVALAHDLGSPSRIAYASISLGTRLSEVDLERAEAVFAEAIEAARRAQNDWIDSFAANQLAVLQARMGNLGSAARTLAERSKLESLKGDHFAASISLNHLAAMFGSMGDEEMALLLAAWGEQQGATFDWTNPMFAGLTCDPNALFNSQSESDRGELLRKVATLHSSEIIEMARERLGRLSAES
jgi:predicted ATPase/class 3 adenylate cyclase